MKRLLLWACRTVSESNDKKLSCAEYERLRVCYHQLLLLGEKELPCLPAKPKGKRGRLAKSDAHNLWERLKVYEEAVLRFTRDSQVSFTNNRAERDLRMDKVKQKVSGCFRTQQYAEMYCRIASYLKTMAYQGCNPMIAIARAFEGEFDRDDK